jgi:hypothetical protein
LLHLRQINAAPSVKSGEFASWRRLLRLQWIIA